MSPLLVLLGLLLVAWLGGALARGRGLRGFGLPSGSEFLLLGLAVGPQGIGLVHRRDLAVFEPMLAAAVGFVTLSAALRLGRCNRPGLAAVTVVPARAWLSGALFAFVTACIVAAVARYALLHIWHLHIAMANATALALGAALAGSARRLVDWAIEHHDASGPWTTSLVGLTDGGSIVAFLLLAPTAGLARAVPFGMPLLAASLMPLALGAVMGLAVLLLLRRSLPVPEVWAILLGAQLLTAGMCLRAELAIVPATLVMGLVLRMSTTAAEQARRQIALAEGTIWTPLLLALGATIDLDHLGRLGWLALGLAALRIATKLAGSPCILWLTRARAKQSSGLTFGLASSGETALIAAAGAALVLPARLGQLVIVAVAASSLAAESFAPRSLRRALLDLGELSRPNDSGFPTPLPSSFRAAAAGSLSQVAEQDGVREP